MPRGHVHFVKLVRYYQSAHSRQLLTTTGSLSHCQKSPQIASVRCTALPHMPLYLPLRIVTAVTASQGHTLAVAHRAPCPSHNTPTPHGHQKCMDASTKPLTHWDGSNHAHVIPDHQLRARLPRQRSERSVRPVASMILMRRKGQVRKRRRG